MNIDQRKMELVAMLVKIRSESLINQVEKLIKEEMIVGYTTAGEPLTEKEYNKRLAEAEEQIARGEVTSQEDFERESEQW